MSTSGTSARVIPGSGRGRRTTGRSPRPTWPRRARARHGAALELDLRHAARPAAAEAAARHTGLTVIVDHLGNPANPAAADPGEWREQVRRVAGSAAWS
ncbi:amidohydrolase family protein [Nonomuraea fuscirosea]|uniref:amidohydrolase family protein n=1 Tax=Nonomuraea fuscirosea TaxID=1291556 RepID=UPI0033CD460C